MISSYVSLQSSEHMCASVKAQAPSEGDMPANQVRRPAELQDCTSMPHTSASCNTQHQQPVWLDVPLHNNHPRPEAVSEQDTPMVWGSDDDLTQAGAEEAEPVSAMAYPRSALQSSHDLADQRQPVDALFTQPHYSINSGNMSESAYMPAVAASTQAVHCQHDLHSVPSPLLLQHDPATQHSQPLGSLLRLGTTTDTDRQSSQHEPQLAGYNSAGMPVCSGGTNERITEQPPVNKVTSQHLARTQNTHDAQKMSQSTTATQACQLWPAASEGEDNATELGLHTAAVLPTGNLHLHAAARCTALQYRSCKMMKDPAPAAAPACASAETAATPTTIKAPLHSLATSSQVSGDGQQHISGMSNPPVNPAEITTGLHVWKRKKNGQDACLSAVHSVI